MKRDYCRVGARIVTLLEHFREPAEFLSMKVIFLIRNGNWVVRSRIFLRGGYHFTLLWLYEISKYVFMHELACLLGGSSWLPHFGVPLASF